jgi:hypothetical protein
VKGTAERLGMEDELAASTAAAAAEH